MSKEKLQAFAEAVSKSEELQRQLASIQVESAKSMAEKLAKLSESAGAPFTAEEYLQSVVEPSEEMSAEQLLSVAGGAWEPNAANIWSSVATLGLYCGVLAIWSAAIGHMDVCSPDETRKR
jgi:hypothetical protein